MKPQPNSPEWHEQQAKLREQFNDGHHGVSSQENPICPVCGRRHEQPATGPHINQYDQGEDAQ